MKVVINSCFGGFSLSHFAVMKYAEKKGMTLYPYVDKRDETQEHRPRITDRFVPYISPNGCDDLVYYFTKPLKGQKWPAKKDEGTFFYDRDIERNDPALVSTVEELGEKANGRCAKLKIVDIPSYINWEISEYDGNESVEEIHRSWS